MSNGSATVESKFSFEDMVENNLSQKEALELVCDGLIPQDVALRYLEHIAKKNGGGAKTDEGWKLAETSKWVSHYGHGKRPVTVPLEGWLRIFESREAFKRVALASLQEASVKAPKGTSEEVHRQGLKKRIEAL